ncbi:putative gustatory receptor 28b [Aedes albopictus]|uniref:Gustatory receptor n=1 Tax=Aedes albopictus TaxID=7160 RepID=A0ABM1Y2V7_AEDAL
MLQAVTMSVFFTIFVVFGLIHAYAIDASETMMQVAKNNIVYDEFYVLVFVLMVVFASLVGRNCNRVKTPTHKAICYGSYGQRIFRELRCFSQQLEHHTPKINCGMLDLDWTLFYSVAGTFTTYLVILLQFDVGSLGFRHQNET